MTPQTELPLFKGLRKRDKAASEHAAEIAQLAKVMRRLAQSGPTDLEALRRHEGLLTSKGRELAWLGAVPKVAGLVKAGMRRSTLPGSNGNWISTWRLP